MQVAFNRLSKSKQLLTGVLQQRNHSIQLQPTFLEALKRMLEEAGNKLVVIDFYATWCGPCKKIAPKFEELSNSMTNVVFLKIDIDKMDDIAMEYGISSMPTFVFIKNGSEIERFSGSNTDKLVSLITEHEK